MVYDLVSVLSFSTYVTLSRLTDFTPVVSVKQEQYYIYFIVLLLRCSLTWKTTSIHKCQLRLCVILESTQATEQVFGICLLKQIFISFLLSTYFCPSVSSLAKRKVYFKKKLKLWWLRNPGISNYFTYPGLELVLVVSYHTN